MMSRWIKFSVLVFLTASCVSFGALWIWADKVRNFRDVRQNILLWDEQQQLIQHNVNPRFGLRHWVKLTDVSPFLIQAVLDQEDRRFFSHVGIDPVAVGRALYQNIKAIGFVQGGSTVTQQLGKLLIENWRGEPPPRTLFWKCFEAVLALNLEVHESKEILLERYLNNIYLGHRLYGVQAASLAYFGKSAKDLDLEESKILASHIRRPNQPRQLWAKKNSPPQLAPHWLTLLQSDFFDSLKIRGDLQIETTLNADIQTLAAQALKNQLASFRKTDSQLQGAVVVIDLEQSELKALIGSESFDDPMRAGQVNHALALRQPGSTLKPFTYFLAFLHHRHPANLVIDAPYHFYSGEDRSYTPKNFDRRFHGILSLRQALANSLNIPAVLTLEELGNPYYLKLLQEFGLNSLNQSAQYYGLALTLGSGSVNLLELTNAYAALARGGQFRFLKILKRQPEFPVLQQLSYSSLERSQAAYLIADILSDAEGRRLAFGEAPLMTLDDQPVAVKTGTSHHSRDAWAIGYTPRYVVGVWVGHTDNSVMDNLTGAKVAIPIWHQVMQALHQNLPKVAFQKPAGIDSQVFCQDSSCNIAKIDLTRAESHPSPFVAQPQESLRFLSPVDGDRFILDLREPKDRQQLALKVRVPNALREKAEQQSQKIEWKVDGKIVQTTSLSESQIFIPLELGKHELFVMIGKEKTRPVRIEVLKEN